MLVSLCLLVAQSPLGRNGVSPVCIAVGSPTRRSFLARRVPPVRGGDVTIVQNGLMRTYLGSGRTFTILGNRNRITITGDARRIVINGNRNTLHADRIGSLSIPGDRNNVHYNHGIGADAARVSLLGNDNRVRRP